ncbi:Asp-tRNA(Asn)/Glu-tRNA(Gln) amidotransferase GatCAB subunit C [bacterium (Candidatus Gribaldobacteria) CG07_land_8_20_14_0_80_33_18]|uniref:Asp-tRNA(Asn)/Glu-tRNA(Gln) amidotransferase GatCAB subunit C n=1 Tax=bacterium (Candidatus Gribaldobacteria) CG07_land_8_20_14_0_80_33_18 TaxID=2014272 RepID=A0A2M6Z1P9_9BACT|nr:MAG: Asp-tRNA(Asn)/Glu-tRNA(Gln) amidotransferase GatCAB subunit C [bacterium (Candidatus Gribaldobacteria) CG10_big_fil_rev_8_21_14_0_10_33_41]PIU46331.1 MAG: Asp-tRNA(Asn)/Glu-tRNA(Gln) amidotransferase GatCAB subunit C [bacterium (Candidatus Gribaldobacteria) CG07_land_8_20_14_0_80_33_18]PJA00667.1 MAG: Asp-tRNA(Asn)/Glu-tRNA(Gln) amidotransferase GatCAB subunit C [bacterium (Candidatus Gribaldobacteria) CG_4_10_14_0_2_um_filter_33_15]PJB08137.1 MAG: Asp-tRNA(Asn)/Glu-tRNA(Gln) amidotransf
MVSKKEVCHIAKLARIGLKDTEIEKMQKELSLILDYFKNLAEVDISKVKLISDSIFNVTREDKIKTEENIFKLIETAPQKEKGYIKVKSVF